MRAKFVPEPVRFVNVRIELELRPGASLGCDPRLGAIVTMQSRFAWPNKRVARMKRSVIRQQVRTKKGRNTLRYSAIRVSALGPNFFGTLPGGGR